MAKLKTTNNAVEMLELLLGDGRKTVPFLVALPRTRSNMIASEWREELKHAVENREMITSTSGLTASVVVSYCMARNIDCDLRTRHTSDGKFMAYKVLFDWSTMRDRLVKDKVI